MEHIEQRAVIKYFFLKGLSPQEIFNEMNITLGENSASYSMIKKWVSEFKKGRTSTSDADRSGRPKDVTTPETVEAIHNIILKDRRSTIRYVAEILKLSYGSVQSIIKNNLEMSKVSARWVPKNLTPDMKKTRKLISEDLLQRLQSNPEAFLARVVTQDETWVHHFDPETKEQSKQWKHKSSPPPRKFKLSSSAGKVMASVFWDSQGVLLIDYLAKGETITGNYYARLLKTLRDKIKEKRRGKLSKGILLLHDNASAHTSQIAIATAQDCGFEILPHPPYSPDLAPSDFYLFPKLKFELKGKHFANDDDVIAAVEIFLESQSENFFMDGLVKLEKRWTRCIEHNGDYFEK